MKVWEKKHKFFQPTVGFVDFTQLCNGRNRILGIIATFSSAETEICLLMNLGGNMETKYNSKLNQTLEIFAVIVFCTRSG